MRVAILGAIVLALSACSSGGGEEVPADSGGSPTDDSGTGAGDAGGETVVPTSCKADADCLTGVTFSPEGCAAATCDAASGVCSYKAKDLDGDGIPAKVCDAPGLTIERGTDCDDGNDKTRPGADEICDGKDNDCDGTVDEDLPMSTDDCAVGVGECKQVGKKLCVDGSWSGCTATPGTPGVEKCDGLDNDCDGTVDTASCECIDGSTQACGKSAIGSCKKGTQACAEGKWLPCVGNVDPKDLDTCADGNDDSCDGITTNGPIPNDTCKCLDGATASCGTVLAAKGACASGTSTCSGGKWAACSIKPKASDTCDEGNDDDCDGNPTKYMPLHLPSSCECVNGRTTNCSLRGYLGSCGDQFPVCSSGKTNCPSSMGSDTCDPGNDNSCNGVKNEGCYCLLGYKYACSGGTICSGGWKSCLDGKANTYGACTGDGATVYQQTYRYDGDGDGACAAKATYITPTYYTLTFREYTGCSSPGAGWKLKASCSAADCYDANGYYSACGGVIPPNRSADWGKPWGGGYNCQDHAESIDCGLGYVFSSGNSYKSGGGGTYTNLGCSGYGTQWGSCSARVCDYWTESATVHYDLSCTPYGATSF